MSVGDLVNKEDRPPYVTFHRIAKEFTPEGAGSVQFRDVDYVHITPAYTKDVIKHEVKSWFARLAVDSEGGRIAPHWVDSYKRQYEAWKNGQELPVDGTPIRGWGLLSPAQQETLTRLNIRTVEDCAGINAGAIRMIGMGAMEIKNKAIAYLAASKDVGPVALENARLKSKLELAEKSLDDLTKKVEALMAIARDGNSPAYHEDPPSAGIAASDLIDNEGDLSAQYEAKFGRKPHHKMKPETIRAALQG